MNSTYPPNNKMSTPNPIVKAFVSEGASSQIVVQVVDTIFLGTLIELGFVVKSDTYPKILSITVPSQNAKAQLFSTLRDEGVCFSDGRDWCPSGVFEYLRDQNMVSGFYRRIAWTAPGKSLVIENC
jgi:hypothetical protein